MSSLKNCIAHFVENNTKVYYIYTYISPFTDMEIISSSLSYKSKGDSVCSFQKIIEVRTRS